MQQCFCYLVNDNEQVFIMRWFPNFRALQVLGIEDLIEALASLLVLDPPSRLLYLIQLKVIAIVEGLTSHSLAHKFPA